MLAASLVKALLSAILSPAGRIVLLAAAFTGWTYYQRADARHDENDRLTAEYERGKAVEVARQAAVSDAAIRAANARATSAEKRVAEFQEVADELKAEISASGASCNVSDSVRSRLLRIR